MANGFAPKGFDNYSVELHHVKGIGKDFFDVVQIQKTDHILFHKIYGYKDFINIRTLAELSSKIRKVINMQITLLVKNYIEGIVDYIDFISNMDDDSKKYLNELYQKKHMMGFINEAIYEKFPNFYKKFEWCINCGGGFFSKSSLYDFVYDLVLIDFPNCKKYLKYEQNFNLSLSAIPDYLDGNEASKYIEENIFSKMPLDLSKNQQIKYIKEQCKKDFFIESNKIPHWVQSCEWPIQNNKPCRYIGEERKGDLVMFLFENVDTHNIIVIKQYY